MKEVGILRTSKIVFEDRHKAENTKDKKVIIRNYLMKVIEQKVKDTEQTVEFPMCNDTPAD